MRRILVSAVAGTLFISLAGCYYPQYQYAVPEQVAPMADRGVEFSLLKQDAGQYKGTSVVLGGAVLGARVLPEGTQIEVLQLPLDAYHQPSGSYQSSEGRLLVIDPGRRDPAALQGRLITVVGEVLGAQAQNIDGVEHTFPSLSARFIKVWQDANAYPAGAAYPYPYVYPYAPYPYLSVDPFFWYGGFFYEPFYGPVHHYGPPPGLAPFGPGFAPAPFGPGPGPAPFGPAPFTPGPGSFGSAPPMGIGPPPSSPGGPAGGGPGGGPGPGGRPIGR